MNLAIVIGQMIIALGPTVAQAYQLIATKLAAGETVTQDQWDVFWLLSKRAWVDMKPEEAKPV